MKNQRAKDIQGFCEDRARAGEAGYAIAYAILELAHKQHNVAKALDDLALNNLDPAGSPGAVEKLAMELGNLVQVLEAKVSCI